MWLINRGDDLVSFDICGNRLKPGHCEFHPDVQEPFPCYKCCEDANEDGGRCYCGKKRYSRGGPKDAGGQPGGCSGVRRPMWKPITEPPAKNCYVLLACTHHRIPIVLYGFCRVLGDGTARYTEDIYHGQGVAITHWMPLPRHPFAEEALGKDPIR
jgi:hypothetical protein